MLVLSLFQSLTGMLALAFCALTAYAVLRRDRRAPLALTIAGALGLIFFASVTTVRIEMIAVSFLAVVAGVVIGTPSTKRDHPRGDITFDSTASRRR